MVKYFCKLPVPRTARAKLKRISRRIASGTIAIVVLSFSFVGVSGTASPQMAGATAMGGCSDSATADMPSWSWDYWVTANNSSGPAGGNIGWFNSTTSSYIISSNNYTTPVAGQATDVIFTPSAPNSRLVLYMTGGQEWVTTTDNSNVVAVNVTGRIVGISYAFDRSIGSTANSHQYNLETQANTVIGHGGHTPDCIAAVNNVLYDPSFTDPHYSVGAMSATHGVNDPSNHGGCASIVDISCYAANLYNGITTNIGQAFAAFTAGLYTLFVPSDTQISTDWNTFYTMLYNRLGFLTWPFSFVSSLFTAMVTPTTTCCVIGAGTFMGATFPGVDLAFASTHLPALWTLTKDAVQGFTALMIFFMLRSKFMEITSR